MSSRAADNGGTANGTPDASYQCAPAGVFHRLALPPLSNG